MLKQIRKSSLSLALISSLVFLAGCSDIDNDGANTVSGKNEFVSAEVIDDISSDVMLQVIQANINPAATNAFGYKAIKITYNTQNEDDEDVVASGLLVIPTPSDTYQAYRKTTREGSFSVSMICDNHGTIFTDAEAPTNVEITSNLPEHSGAVLMTGYAGFASIIPDYIGYGKSKDVAHPYMLKEASAEASLDMVKASIYYMEQNGIALNYQLYISGYSQGGYTAMALAQEVENEFSAVNLMGVAAMAGPHDLEALADKELDANNTMIFPAFLAYLADSYSFFDEDIPLTDLVLETDTTMYHNLFDGTKNEVEIHAELGLTINNGFGVYKSDELFKTTLINDYKNNINTGAILREEFIQNSTYNWTPKTKVNLIHCTNDEIIPFSMSQKAYDTMTSNGAKEITLTPISSVTPVAGQFVHSNCGSPAYQQAIGWFSAIRNGDI